MRKAGKILAENTRRGDMAARLAGVDKAMYKAKHGGKDYIASK